MTMDIVDVLNMTKMEGAIFINVIKLLNRSNILRALNIYLRAII